ncbi:MAG: hypothetical protein PS018_07670 [bacterium]|nr:hypothetical protein [bacterium]
MKRIILIGAALVASTLAMSLPASARMGIAPLTSPDSEIIQVKHGHGHGHAHRGGRGHHYGWSRGRGHHYGWRHRRHH